MKPEYLIIHCSDSAWGSAPVIRSWHRARGWEDIGYHFVINNGRPDQKLQIISMDGSIEAGRSVDVAGSHCLGYNDKSLGICLVGKTEFTLSQMDTLKELCQELCMKFGIPAENVIGHCETDSGKEQGKTCPNFDVGRIRAWLKGRKAA